MTYFALLIISIAFEGTNTGDATYSGDDWCDQNS